MLVRPPKNEVDNIHMVLPTQIFKNKIEYGPYHTNLCFFNTQLKVVLKAQICGFFKPIKLKVVLPMQICGPC